MAHLLMSMIIPIAFLYSVPFIFGLSYINKKINDSELNKRVAWMVFLFFTPVFAVLVFHLIEVKRAVVLPN